MYQRPVNALAELVANAWDADSKKVALSVPASATDEAIIMITDDGLGMTFVECQNRYLNVGWNRREGDPAERSPGGRPILGRKGIGKFAGFGIAEIIQVKTISKETGELTVFELNLKNLMSDEYAGTEQKPVNVLEYEGPKAARRRDHGTTVTLRKLKLKKGMNADQFSESLARRFIVQQNVGFSIVVGGKPLPEATPSGVEFSFPEGYAPAERPTSLTDIDGSGWGTETLANGRSIRWRFLFLKETLDEEELRGVSIFAHGKLAQAPFLFFLTGGLGGQHGVEYLTGQVIADYLDELSDDLISVERQRINWEHDESSPLLEWGQGRVKELLRIWHDRRGEKMVEMIEKKVARFSERLEQLQPRESKTVKAALKKLARIPSLSAAQFEELGVAMLTAWEQGRLKELIEGIAGTDSLSADGLIGVLAEAQVLTALNTAEAVKTKLLTVGGLKLRVKNRELEAAVRDYIAKHPWLVSPQWETYKVEKGVKGLLKEAAAKANLTGPDWEGRVDLALSSGQDLLVLEFMRPGLPLDWDHLSRFEKYVRTIRQAVKANTAGKFLRVSGYIVADKLQKSGENAEKIESLEKDSMFAMDWRTLFTRALDQWKDFLDILIDRAEDDPRMQALREEL